MSKKNHFKSISKKSRMIAASAFIIGLMAVGGVVHADELSTASSNTGNSVLVSAIASKFNLNPSDVLTVVDEVMTNKRVAKIAHAKDHFSTKVNEEVASGKLTQVQANLILAKVQDVSTQVQTELQAESGLDQADVKAKRKAFKIVLKKDLKSWATANEIPAKFLSFVRKEII